MADETRQRLIDSMSGPSYTLADLLQGRRNPLMDQWWAMPPTLGAEAQPNRMMTDLSIGGLNRLAGPQKPYEAPVSEYTTPGDTQRERISQAFGWDVGRPGQYAGMQTLTALGSLPFGPRVPITLRQLPRPGIHGQTFYDVLRDGQEVGRVGVHPNNTISNIIIDEPFRRQGIATAVYDELGRLRGQPPGPGSFQTPEGRAFRQSYDQRQNDGGSLPFGPQVPVPTRIQNPIRAYHGSPHEFDQFRMENIGTGEGAQAYGHGLYFAEREGVARHYRDTLSGGPNGATGTPGQTTAYILLWRNGNDRAKALADAQDGIRAFSSGMFRRGDPSSMQAYREAEELLRSGWAPSAGHMYEVNIHARPEQFLDWDRPLSGQSPDVLRALRGAGQMGEGRDAYRQLVTRHDGYDAASGALRQAGVPGIRYLDQGSRAGGQGTSNYVLFDPSLVEILRRYGIAAPIAGGAAASSLMGDRQQ